MFASCWVGRPVCGEVTLFGSASSGSSHGASSSAVFARTVRWQHANPKVHASPTQLKPPGAAATLAVVSAAVGKLCLPTTLGRHRSCRRRRAKLARACGAAASGTGVDAEVEELDIKPLGANGASRQELEEAAALIAHGFFVGCYDAAERTQLPPEGRELKRLEQQVYDDLAQRYSPGFSSQLLLATRTGVPVGCVGLEVLPFDELPACVPILAGTAESTSKRRVAYMSNLAVLSSERGKGVGRQLVLEAEKQARDVLGVREIVLLVCAENIPARNLYERLDYKLLFKDPWAVRAIPGPGGLLDKVRVLNFGYSYALKPGERPHNPGTD